MISLAYAALWIFVFSIPWDTLSASSGVAIVTKLTGMSALALTLLAVLGSGHLRRWHLLHVVALLFIIWTGLGLLILNAQGLLGDVGLLENQRKFYTYVQLFVVLWMVWELAPSRSKALGLLTAYVFGAYIAAFDTMLVYRREAGIMRRFAAGGGDPNDLAMTLALALPMAWYLGVIYRQPLLRWACRGYLPVGLVALGLTGSRGGFLATIVALLIVPLTMGRLSAGRRAIAIALLIVSGALAVKYVPETLIERIASTSTVVQEGSLSGRVGIWKAGMAAFIQKPVLGYGAAGFREAVKPWTGTPRVAHNSFLSVLVEQGMVGLLLFLTMLVTVFKGVLTLSRLERRFALVLLATLTVALLPLSWEAQKPVWFILASLLALSQAREVPRGRAVPSANRSPARAAPVRGRPLAARPVEP